MKLNNQGQKIGISRNETFYSGFNASVTDPQITALQEEINNLNLQLEEARSPTLDNDQKYK